MATTVIAEAEEKRASSSFWVVLALTAATAEPILVKIGYRGAVTPLQFLTYRTFFAALAIVPLTRTWHWIGAAGVRRVLPLALLLLCTNGLTLLALSTLSAVTVISAVKVTPALVAIVNCAQGRDRLSAKFWVGFVACFLGTVLVVDMSQTSETITPTTFPLAGSAALLGAIVSSTVYRTRMEVVLERMEPATVSAYIFLLDTVVVGVALLPFAGRISTEGVAVSAFTGIAAAVANVAFLAAIRILGATRMSIIDMLQRPLVIVLAAAVLSEPITLQQAAGIVFILTGVHLAKVQRAQPSPARA